jgi:RNase P/RNase MRP subunit p29
MMTSKIGRVVVVAAVTLCLVQTGLMAAPTHHEEMVEVDFSGEVVKVDGNILVTKMVDGGEIRSFEIREGREFIVDGSALTVDQLEPGTVLTAKIKTVPAPDTVEVASGTIIHISGMTVVMRMDDRKVRQFTASNDWEFDVGGTKKTVRDLRANQRLTAVRFQADPATLITPETEITGTSPK